MSYLAIDSLQVDVGAFHLSNFSLTADKGEYTIILGPTGAGKTVLLETIAGLHPVRSGRIALGDTEITRVPPERRQIGFVYQDYMLFPHLSVAQNLGFGLNMRRIDRRTATGRTREAATLLGIQHLLSRMPTGLSGGEKQRVALARALVIEPQLLLLDEPLSALDPERRESLQQELTQVHNQLSTTTLHVTHDFEEAISLGDRVAVINDGRIEQVGTTDDVFRHPSSQFVARFVGARNLFGGIIKHGEEGIILSLDGMDIAVVTDRHGPAHVSIRPEDILISRGELRSSARNSFRGSITRIVDRGPLIYVTVSVPLPFVVIITRRSLVEMALEVGMEVYIAFKASAVHLF